jgi:hypothetical protein
MSKRLLIDAEGLYAHSRDKLSDLSHKGKRTGGLFGVVKTVDAATRRFDPDVVVLCFSDSNHHVYLDNDALKLGTWGLARGFHLAYMRGGTVAETIKKVAIDMLADASEDVELVIQSWDEGLHGLLADKRVSMISLSDDDEYTHEGFKNEHGFDVRFLARSQDARHGDIVAVPPNPNEKGLKAFLSDLGFTSVLEELKAGDVKLIKPKAISL